MRDNEWRLSIHQENYHAINHLGDAPSGRTNLPAITRPADKGGQDTRMRVRMPELTDKQIDGGVVERRMDLLGGRVSVM